MPALRSPRRRAATIRHRVGRCILAVACLGVLAGCVEAGSGISAESTPAAESAPSSPETLEEAYFGSIPSGDALGEQFTIPAGLSDRQLAARFLANLDAWSSYGSTPQLRAWLDDRGAGEEENLETIAQIASLVAEDIATAWFVQDWRTRDAAGEALQLALFVERGQRINEEALSAYYYTSGDHPEDLEPYRRWTELVEVREFDDPPPSGDRGLWIVFDQRSNDNRNRAEDIVNDRIGPGGLLSTVGVTFATVDDREYVSELVFPD